MGGERDGEMIIQPETRSAVQCSYDMFCRQVSLRVYPQFGEPFDGIWLHVLEEECIACCV
jgi:hypothetical protein